MTSDATPCGEDPPRTSYATAYCQARRPSRARTKLLGDPAPHRQAIRTHSSQSRLVLSVHSSLILFLSYRPNVPKKGGQGRGRACDMRPLTSRTSRARTPAMGGLGTLGHGPVRSAPTLAQQRATCATAARRIHALSKRAVIVVAPSHDCHLPLGRLFFLHVIPAAPARRFTLAHPAEGFERLADA